MSVVEEIEKVILTPLLEEGFELVETQYRKESGQWVLRIFVDKVYDEFLDSSGSSRVDLCDCQRVTALVGNLVDAANVLSGAYVLEVSSPGINRVLKNKAHFLKFMGQKVKVSLYSPLGPESKQKNFSGHLLSCKEDAIEVEDVISGLTRIPMGAIAKAHLDLI